MRAMRDAQTQRAVELRLRGLGYRAIGALMSIDYARVARLVNVAMDETRARTIEDVDRLRELEGHRMDALIDALWDGRADPQVAGSIVRASERRAKLFGLDAPMKFEQRVEVAPALHLENLTLEELEQYERLLAKVEAAPQPAIDVTPEQPALPEHEPEAKEIPGDASAVREG